MKFAISSGTLNVESSQEVVTLRMEKGEDKAYGNAGSLTIVDATGSGSGWGLSLKIMPMIEIGLPKEVSSKWSPGDLSLITQEAKIRAGEGSSESPQWFGNRTYEISESVPTKILSASPGEGMGTYHIDFGADSLKFSHSPSQHNTNTDTYYQTTLVWNIVSGPYY
ncbi:WxL domain-containing protein [Halalkalibacter alkaliphilus]